MYLRGSGNYNAGLHWVHDAVHTISMYLQVYGHERVAITVPDSAARHFEEALRLCLRQLPSQTAVQMPGSQDEVTGERM